MVGKFLAALGWYAGEYIKDYRESAGRIYELSVKTTIQINQIILTVSVASLAAIAALNEAVFTPYGPLALTAISLFVLVILLSVINLYVSMLTLADAHQQLLQNLKSFTRLDKNMKNFKFKRLHKILSMIIFAGFCLGLVVLLILLGVHILGAKQ